MTLPVPKENENADYDSESIGDGCMLAYRPGRGRENF
jgi:hypothetical protein